MKKLLVIGLVFIIIFCIICCTAYPPDLSLDTPEKIAEVFYANEKLFNTAVESVVAYKEQDIYITPIQDNTRADFYVVKEINGLYFEASDSLTDSDFQALYGSFAPLFAACNFRGVAMYGSHIRVHFVLEDSFYDEAAELYYFPDEDFGAYYMSQSEGAVQIAPHWYAEIAHY